MSERRNASGSFLPKPFVLLFLLCNWNRVSIFIVCDQDLPCDLQESVSLSGLVFPFLNLVYTGNLPFHKQRCFFVRLFVLLTGVGFSITCVSGDLRQ